MKTEKTSKINVFFLILLFCVAIVSAVSFATNNIVYGHSCVQGDACSVGKCVSDQNIPCDQTNPIFCGCCNSGEKWDSSIKKCAKVDWTTIIDKGSDNSDTNTDSNSDNLNKFDNVSFRIVILDDESLIDSGVGKDVPKVGEKNYCKYEKQKFGLLCDENEKGCSKNEECKNGLVCTANTCVKKTNLKFPLNHNEGICTKNSDCNNHLFCTDEFESGNVDLGVCCYEWETKDDATGNCVLNSKEGDLDSDKNANFGEDELYANPIVETSVPMGTMFDTTCTNYFGEKDNNWITLGAANTARYAANKLGIVEGAAIGLKDDAMVIPDLVVTGYKLAEGTSSGKIDWSDMKLPSVKEVWENLIQLNVDEVVGTSLAINLYNKYNNECIHNSHNKGFVSGHYKGYLTEQVAITFVPIAGIALKAGKIGGMIGKILEGSLKALDLLLNGMGKVFDKVFSFIKDTHFQILLKWDENAKKGFAKLIVADDKFAKKAVNEFGASGAHKIGYLCDLYDISIVKQFAESANGKYLIKTLSADDLTYLFNQVNGKEQFAKYLNSMSKDDLKSYARLIKLGKKLKVEEEVASKAAKTSGDVSTNIPGKKIDDEVEKEIAKDNYNKIRNTYGNEIADDVGSEYVDRVATIASKLTNEESTVFLKTLQEISSKYGKESAQATVNVIEKYGNDVIGDVTKLAEQFDPKLLKNVILSKEDIKYLKTAVDDAFDGSISYNNGKIINSANDLLIIQQQTITKERLLYFLKDYGKLKNNGVSVSNLKKAILNVDDGDMYEWTRGVAVMNEFNDRTVTNIGMDVWEKDVERIQANKLTDLDVVAKFKDGSGLFVETIKTGEKIGPKELREDVLNRILTPGITNEPIKKIRLAVNDDVYSKIMSNIEESNLKRLKPDDEWIKFKNLLDDNKNVIDIISIEVK